MTQTNTPVEQRREVENQVNAMLARSSSFHALPLAEQESIRANTTAVVDTLVQNKLRQSADPFAVPMDAPTGPMPLQGGPLGGGGATGGAAKPTFTGGATKGQDGKSNFGPTKLGDFGSGIAMGVAQTGQLLREINFPAFVAELVQGVFQAVVDASIQQMKAYGELVQSVTMSLNDFRDQNVSTNQGRDHLAQKYPTLMQVNITDTGPRVGPRPDIDDSSLPNFREELGLDEDISSLDEETIEEKLVPAARNDLARSRQGLLATMVLMGINRIIVTDGKINAKLKFDFRARDTMQTNAQTYDYKNFGNMTVQQSTNESSSETGEGYKESRNRGGWLGSNESRSGESSRWSKGTDQLTTAPVIYLTGQSDTHTNAEISAEGSLRSDVTLSFKSETFDLNKLASADEVFKMERVRSAGRGTPAAGTPAAAGAAPAAATTPAATTPQPATATP